MPRYRSLGMCAQQQLPMIPLSRYEIDAELLELLDRDFTWEHGALPLSRIGSVVIVAIPDVPPAAAIQTLRDKDKHVPILVLSALAHFLAVGPMSPEEDS